MGKWLACAEAIPICTKVLIEKDQGGDCFDAQLLLNYITTAAPRNDGSIFHNGSDNYLHIKTPNSQLSLQTANSHPSTPHRLLSSRHGV